MLYETRLGIEYDYGRPVAGGRHLLRVLPRTLQGVQSVESATLDIDPKPSEHSERHDFHGNVATALALDFRHARLEVTMHAKVRVHREPLLAERSSLLRDLAGDIAAFNSLAPETPHHFRGPTARLPRVEPIAAWARESVEPSQTVHAVAAEICHRIHSGFAYDPDATLVNTPIAEAFALRRGVCQDFAHIMIAALQAIGIPASYVSGFIRTIPPPGRERLEGADAMHAWVRAWCGRNLGWVEFDPTNDKLADDDFITVAHGRDYLEASPVVGVLEAGGAHRTEQYVDVIPIAE